MWERIIGQADEVGHTMTQMAFFGKDYEWKNPFKNEARKFSYESFKRISKQSALLSQSIIIENLYLVAKEIREDATLSDKEKVDLLFGDVELLLQENCKQMLDGQMTTTIDHIRATHKVKA